MTVELVGRRDDELGAWRMWARPVDSRLSAWGSPIRGYDQVATSPGRHTTAASALLPLVIPVGHRHRVFGADGRMTEVGAFVAGSHDAIGAVEATGFTGVQVDLTPLAAHRILGGGVAELAGSIAPLDAVFGRAGDRLVERLGNTGDWARRLDLVERFLVDRLDDGPDPDDVTAVVWRRLATGATTVDAAVDGLAYSLRQLRRRVVAGLGLPPKRLARLVRFHRTLVRLERDQRTPLARIAVELGFADQPHLTREFRDFAGTTPATMRTVRAPAEVSDSFNRDDTVGT